MMQNAIERYADHRTYVKDINKLKIDSLISIPDLTLTI
jgi:hypothetical protein